MTLPERIAQALSEPIDQELMEQALQIKEEVYGVLPLKDAFYTLLLERKALLAQVEALKAENLTMAQSISNYECEFPQLSAENDALRARIALLESALGLPEGCDPFDIKRAEIEGARTSDGIVMTRDASHDQNAPRLYYFKSVSAGMRTWVDDEGESPITMRLYCIKKGSA